MSQTVSQSRVRQMCIVRQFRPVTQSSHHCTHMGNCFISQVPTTVLAMSTPCPPAIRRSLTLGGDMEITPMPAPSPLSIDLPQIGCPHYEEVENSLAVMHRFALRYEGDALRVEQLEGSCRMHETVLQSQAQTIARLIKHVDYLTQTQTKLINAVNDLCAQVATPAVNVRSTTPSLIKRRGPV
jgi:hypothetical protein